MSNMSDRLLKGFRFAYSARGRFKSHRQAVHAVTQPGRFGAVIEDMTKVTAAAPAMHLRARYTKRQVLARADRGVERRPKTRPAGMAVELRARRKEVELAPGARKRATAMFIVQRAAVGAFGTFVPQHVVLRGSQHAAPLVVGMNDFERFIGLPATWPGRA